MSLSLSQLLEESLQIAWEYLERIGELGDGAAASRFLGEEIESMIRRCDLQLSDVPSAIQDFVEHHEGHDRQQLALRLV